MGKPVKEWGVVKFLRDKIGDVGREVTDVVVRGESPLKAASDLIFGSKGAQLTEEEKKRAFELAMIDHEEWKLSVQDTQHARRHGDNQLQKIFALGFGAAYVIVTVLFIWISWKWSMDQVEINEFSITIISTIFGAMSAKVNTIVDFLFGSSQGSKDKSNQFNELLSKSD